MLKCRSYTNQISIWHLSIHRSFWKQSKHCIHLNAIAISSDFKLSKPYHIYNIRFYNTTYYTCILHQIPNIPKPFVVQIASMTDRHNSGNQSVSQKICYCVCLMSKVVITCLAKWPESPNPEEFSPSSESGCGGALKNLPVAPETNGHHMNKVAKACILPWQGWSSNNDAIVIFTFYNDLHEPM